MSTIAQKFNTDPNEEFYVLTKPHLNDMFPLHSADEIENLTWHDVGKIMLTTKQRAKHVVKFTKGIKDSQRKEIIEMFGIHRIICEENKVLCVDENDAAFIKMKYC